MLPDYQTIVYATDLAPRSRHALRHALSLAKKLAAELHILHVMSEMEASVVNYVASVVGEERFEAMELSHEKEMRAGLLGELQDFVARELGTDTQDRPLRVEVRHGDPAVEIIGFADEVHADLVVVGSHGKGALHYAFIGSVARKVLHHCKRPVLTVRLPDP